jgi:hypothetical protein
MLNHRLFIISCTTVFALLSPDANCLQPAKPGSLSWRDKYPKVIDAPDGKEKGSVSVLGEYKSEPGFKLVEAELYYSPTSGGVKASAGKLKSKGGKWGETREGEIVEKKVEIPKGKWQVWVQARFKPDCEERFIDYYTPFKLIEIK